MAKWTDGYSFILYSVENFISRVKVFYQKFWRLPKFMKGWTWICLRLPNLNGGSSVGPDSLIKKWPNMTRNWPKSMFFWFAYLIWTGGSSVGPDCLINKNGQKYVLLFRLTQIVCTLNKMLACQIVLYIQQMLAQFALNYKHLSWSTLVEGDD